MSSVSVVYLHKSHITCNILVSSFLSSERKSDQNSQSQTEMLLYIMQLQHHYCLPFSFLLIFIYASHSVKMFYKPLYIHTWNLFIYIHTTCAGTEHDTQQAIHKWQKIETVNGANRTLFIFKIHNQVWACWEVQENAIPQARTREI